MALTVKENEISAVGPETAQRTAPATAAPADTAIKHQPVALEVPVTVNGARTVEGGDKREPFSETTKTVLVFGNGAVIRLSSAVAPGQLLFLTNEKTKKEVVCQVVKSKNYRNVSGYVELEFTEPVVGFWGMRFPGDRIGSGPQPVAPAPVLASSSSASGLPAVPRPVAPRVEAPAVNASSSFVAPKPAVAVSGVKEPLPKPAESRFVVPEAPVSPFPAAPNVEESFSQKPVAPVSRLSSTLSTSFDPTAPLNLPAATPPPVAPIQPAAPVSTIPEVSVTPAPVQHVAPASVLFDAPRASEAQASFLEPAKTATTQGVTTVPNLLSLFEAKPAEPSDVPPPPSVDSETEALKQHTARLQEQLSSMLFSGKPTPPATISVQIPHVPAVVIQKDLAENAAKILEMSHISAPEPPPAKPVEAVKLDPPSAKSLLADEELKIPAWLEPLARNAAAPTSTQELIDREKTRRLAEQPDVEQIAAEASKVTEEQNILELPVPSFVDPAPAEEVLSARESGTGKSSKGLLFAAVAAGVLAIAGGGWWYMQQQSAGVHSSPAPAQKAQTSLATVPSASIPSTPQENALPRTNSPAQTTPPEVTLTSAPSKSASNTLTVVPAVVTSSTPRNSQSNSNPANGGKSTTSSASAVPAASEQPKKPILGDVHLAAPKVSANRSTQSGGEPDAGVALTNDDQPETNPEALNGGLVGGNKQPSAPVAPLPVGGDVKQARQLSTVPPVYPVIAKNQHVSGNVLVDALIDSNGKVTTMKVLSGPVLLHQAAMDALKQWKYEPATLDGKPVAMHLTVTIQFRLQ
jgi:protein TonB